MMRSPLALRLRLAALGLAAVVAAPGPVGADMPAVQDFYLDVPGFSALVAASYGPETATAVAAAILAEAPPGEGLGSPYAGALTRIGWIGTPLAMIRAADPDPARLAAFLEEVNAAAPLRSMLMSRDLGGCILHRMELAGDDTAGVLVTGAPDPYEGCTTYGDPASLSITLMIGD
ncbi:hypothetical protein [Roseicyclus persicicus]|uniref:Uncharacterized protein n=1 Tax=Roseicyclus persicicus TaxID=2650661 RepID=A0A7X6GZJ0_9RHOB|nr:hypothetical protein [Roseibacterium persicicum]NKX44126.1 hypothetical protein [Roseibacterium persicicum]